jgi:hypothetical protein
MRFKPQQERLLQLPGPPSPRRTRPTPQHDSEDSDISLKTCSYHHLLFSFSFFSSSSWLFHLSLTTHYTNYKRGGSHMWTHPAAGHTRGGGARHMEPSTRYCSSQDCVDGVATREDFSGSRGRVRRGGAAAQDPTVSYRTGRNTGSEPPAMEMRRAVPRHVSLVISRGLARLVARVELSPFIC